MVVCQHRLLVQRGILQAGYFAFNVRPGRCMSKSIETTSTTSGRQADESAPALVMRSGLNQMSAIGAPPAAEGANYEQALEANPRWALSEGSRHFESKSAVFDALQKIAKRLTELEVPYSIVGGMALFHHSLRRFTEGVDILVTKHDLKKIHAELSGRGYRPPHRHSKHLRDTQLGIRIEFLTSGDYPGDGKQKPVAFPDPAAASTSADGISYINLPTLVELKLASGMTNAGRLKDLADVLELIKALNLQADFAIQLNPYVRGKYTELWKAATTPHHLIEESESWREGEDGGVDDE
jgi:hypothetical protein